jgi:hypothetical protein
MEIGTFDRGGVRIVVGHRRRQKGVNIKGIGSGRR